MKKKKLLIVESPAKIKTISKFLGNDFTILSTMGHIKDLPTKKLGVDMDANKGIKIDYVVLDKKEKVIADICKAANGAPEIYIGPDPDREGELIAWHVEQEILNSTKQKPGTIHRITFNEITKSAIEEALTHPKKVNVDLVNAQQARRILDRLVGYEVSPILWKKIAKGLSAGRVQSVALRLICDREEALRSFKPEESWTIEVIFTINKVQVPATLTHVKKKKVELKTEKDARKVADDLKNHQYAITSIKDTQRSKNPAPPFMTSTLQQSAYNQLGFSVDKTMQLAQKLYEGIPLDDASTPIALITYMRTDSLRVADSALQESRKFIKSAYGDEYLPSKAHHYSKKAAQDAHEAIRPIDVRLTPEKVSPYLEPAMAKLYALIWKRFVACQMNAALYAQRQVIIESDTYSFKATGSTLLFDGFLKVYHEVEEEDGEAKTALPDTLQEKTPATLKKIDPKQHFTQPPARFTQASLVKELEKEGIGRPSTYATILKTIQARSYTELDSKKRFTPTELGMAVTKLLVENLPNIMDARFTAAMEEDLDKVAHGTLQRDELLHNFHEVFEKQLATFQGDKKRPVEETEIVCPTCKDHKLVIKFGKAGPFLACPGYPECTFTSNFERTEDGTIKMVAHEQPKLLDELCPQCGKQLRQMVGRYGPFVACSGYPECKYIKQVKASFPCPQSGGDVVRRTWKGKVFWGCSDYPKCTFSISGDIEDKPCPKCKKPYLQKRVTKDGTHLQCADKECGYTE
jgi:DNA topoisomerase-1